MSKKVICKLCNFEFDYQSGSFSNHLKNEHKISKEQYVVLIEYGGIHPKCQCGYCNDDAKFIDRKNKFYNKNSEHKSFDWIKQKYIEKNGVPFCVGCKKKPVEFYRGKPNLYCCHECQPSNWNQEQVKKTVIERYGVDNIMKVKTHKDKINKKFKEKHGVNHSSQVPGHGNKVKKTK